MPALYGNVLLRGDKYFSTVPELVCDLDHAHLVVDREFLLARDADNFGVNGGFAAIEILDELDQPAFAVKVMLGTGFFVGQFDA